MAKIGVTFAFQMEAKILNDYIKLNDREKRFLDFFKSLESDSDVFLSDWLSNSLKKLSDPTDRLQKLDNLKDELIDQLRETEYKEIVKSL